VIGDFNSDNALDVATANSDMGDFGNGTVSVLLNKAGTQVTARSGPNPSQQGQAVTLTATVTGTVFNQRPPTGTVMFKDGNTVLATVTLKQGTARFITSHLSVGTHVITTSYSGDANYNSNTGPNIVQVVQ